MAADAPCGGEHAIPVRSFPLCCAQEPMLSVAQWLPCLVELWISGRLPGKKRQCRY